METVLSLLLKIIGKQRYARIIVCLVLIAFGVPSSEIHKKFGTSLSALRKYKSALQSGQIDHLIEFKGSRTQSTLNDYEDIILEEFDATPPKTLRDAQERIRKMTGLDRSLHRIRVWLKKRGLKAEL